MATHDYVIDNQTPANLRADLNNALQAIVTQNSGSSAPTTTFSNMLWYDTGNNQIKKRNEADSAWITLGTVDEGTGKFTPNAAITTSEIAAATLVTSTDTIASNNNNTTIPTSAAVKAYADSVSVTKTSGSAPYYGLRAWVRVTGSAIQGSANISSFDASSNLIYFTTAHSSAYYTAACDSTSYGNTFIRTYNASYAQIESRSSGGNYTDPTTFSVIFAW